MQLLSLIVALGVVKEIIGEKVHQTKCRSVAVSKSYTMVPNSPLISSAMFTAASVKVQEQRAVNKRHVQLAKAKELQCRQLIWVSCRCRCNSHAQSVEVKVK